MIYVKISMNEDANYAFCTPSMSVNLTDKYIILHQLKPFKRHLHDEHKQSDGVNSEKDDENAFSLTSKTCEECMDAQNSS